MFTKHKLIIFTLLPMFAAIQTPFAAEATANPDVSGNVTYTTDYRFRGISQGDRSHAIQGGFDISSQSGFYAGTWASNVTFSGAAIEVDYYIGWTKDIDEESSLDLGFIYYNYPEDDATTELDYVELYANYNWKDLGLGLAFSDDYFAETSQFWYFSAAYTWSLPADTSLETHIGYNLFDDDQAFTSFIGPASGQDPGNDYVDYGLTLSKNMHGIDWSLAIIGTDLDEDECFAGTKLCDDGVVLSMSRGF